MHKYYRPIPPTSLCFLCSREVMVFYAARKHVPHTPPASMPNHAIARSARKISVPRPVTLCVQTYSRKYCAQDDATGMFYGRKHPKFWLEGFQRAVQAVYVSCTREAGWSKMKTEAFVGRYLVNTNSSLRKSQLTDMHTTSCLDKAKKWKERYGAFATNGTTPPSWEVGPSIP